jgi:membrane protein DedA with SNARE-associated domain
MPHITELVELYGYPVIALIILLENAGIPVPGETALFTAGYLSSPEGGEHLSLWAVALVGFISAVIGDNIGFLLGRRLVRARLDAGRRFLFLTPQRMQAAEVYFEKYGALTVFFARFVALLRIVGGPAAGAAGMRWSRFVLANAAGALCWAVGVAVLGHTAGHAWKAMRSWLGQGAWAVLIAVVIAILVWRFAFRKRQQEKKPVRTPSKSPPG